MRLEHSLKLYTETKPKWIKDISVRSETIKLLEENKGKIFFDIRQKKRKIEWIGPNLILKPFFRGKETIDKIKRQPTYEMGENICNQKGVSSQNI